MIRVLSRIVIGIAQEIISKIKIKHSSLRKLVILYVIVWTISPPLQVDMIYRYLALGCMGIYFLLILSEHRKFQKIHIWVAMFAVAVFAIAYMETGSMSGALKQIPIYILALCFIINYCYEDRWEELRGVVPIVLLLLIAWNLKTVGQLIQDSTVARSLVRSDESTYQYLRQGVGGYSLIYPQVCIFPAILAWIMKAFQHNRTYFALGSVWITSYILYLLKAGYSIAIFASAVGAFILLFHKGKNVFGSFLLAAGMFIGVLLLIVHVEPLRNALLEAFDGTAVAKKINDLMSTSASGEAEGSLAARSNAYLASIQAIFQFPFIGGIWFRSGGGHSAILDVFAKYGVWGGYMYAMMIYYVPNYYKRRYQHRLILSISKGTLVSLLFVSILDSFSYSFMGMIMLVLPLLYEDIIKWERIQT